MEREKEDSLPRFHDGFLWTGYYKILVRKDYFFGKHYERVRTRRLVTIERLKSQLTEYKNREEQIAKDRTDLTKERGALTQKEESITEKEKNYEEMEGMLEHYRRQTLQQTEDMGRLEDDNEKLRKRDSQLEERVKSYERTIAFRRQVIRELKRNQLLILIEEVKANIGRKDLVAVVDDKDKVVYPSPGLIAELGYDEKEVTGQDYHRFLEKPSDEFLDSKEEHGILNLKKATGEPLLVKVSRRLYENPIEINEHEVNIYSGAKVKFEELGFFERRRIKGELEKKEQKKRLDLEEKAAQIKKDMEKLRKELGMKPGDIEDISDEEVEEFFREHPKKPHSSD